MIGYCSCAIGLFCEQFTERGLDPRDIDEAVRMELQDSFPKSQSTKEQRGRQRIISRFSAHSVDAGIIAPPIMPNDTEPARPKCFAPTVHMRSFEARGHLPSVSR